MNDRAPFPHCDSRVLHAPSECTYCDGYPELQQARQDWRVAFTGHEPVGDEAPCPADTARPPNGSSDHRRWSRNRAVSGNPRLAPPLLPELDGSFTDEWLDLRLIEGLPVGEGMMTRLARRLRTRARP
jgi:hypothetical protein